MKLYKIKSVKSVLRMTRINASDVNCGEKKLHAFQLTNLDFD